MRKFMNEVVSVQTGAHNGAKAFRKSQTAVPHQFHVIFSQFHWSIKLNVMTFYHDFSLNAITKLLWLHVETLES